ncbi:ABC transporter ATP-binding protein [Streptomyces sp. NBC_01190]|uniref:ABC transporter ATP-binding protein n=1 Tax=Streptomyces sp. NBC_01190 TaxID=2903767 RepID=UPI00386ECF81|nr:ABC transporter ATP-binding protein [Streptomyces sp. NBC_01190]
MSAPAIELDGLGRTYDLRTRRVTALRDVSLRVEEGQIVGLLGHNGAGKTTLTKILSTLLLPTSGTAKVFGHDVVGDVRKVRRLTGVVFGGDQGLYGRLSGRDNVRFFAMLNGLPRRSAKRRVEEVLAEVGMTDAAGRLVNTYSKGMRQRLHIAIGMATSPRLLLLDEPSIGLDPVEADRLRTAVMRLREESDTTVVLTTHNLLDVERLADRVVLLSGGRVVRDTDVRTFARAVGYVAVVTVRGQGPRPDVAADMELPETGTPEARPGGNADRWTVTWRVPEWNSASFAHISEVLTRGSADTRILAVDVAPVRLEDAYIDAGKAVAGVGRG